jgi:glycine betaine/choline ABC-type transport system substrate-binding protein
MMALLLERGGVPVERKFGFGSTQLLHGALVAGAIDLYAEYTGTAAQAVLGAKGPMALDAIRETYRARFGLECLDPLGFDDTYALAVRGADAEAKGWKRISDLVPFAASLRAGLNAEFLERPDGWPGLRKAYGLDITKTVNLDAGLVYQALKEGKVDVISAFSTDGRLDAWGFCVLEDDRRFFPRYEPVPVVRPEALARFPALRAALAGLAGRLDESTMRRLNREVDVKGRSPRDVAREFLAAPAAGRGDAR